MSSSRKRVLAGFVIFLLISSSFAQNCNTHKFVNNKSYRACNDLPVLNSFLHWNYDSLSSTVQIAYRQPVTSSSRWAAWAVNPTSAGMVGSQAFVAYQQTDGTVKAYTSPVNSYGTMLQEGNLSFPVTDLSAIYSNNEITIFATFELSSNSTTLNQVWQEGPVSRNTLRAHDFSGPNILSMGTVDLLSGQTSTITRGGNSRIIMRNAHGVLNAVSWGIMMPFGAMIARYLKVFKSANPAWFYIHITCQSLAYLIGISGFTTGIILGNKSGVHHTSHKNIGICLLCLATLQVFALFLRPKKDHKYRKYWTAYHQGTGYAVIILSILNVFKGLGILAPNHIWKILYISFITVLACIAVGLEAFTWSIVLKRNKSGEDKTPQPTQEEKGSRQQLDV